MAVSPEEFKACLGCRATAVSIVTARAGEEIHGMTVSDFTSVSLDPPLVVVCAADEEVGGRLGTKWLADEGYIPECDFIVVGEQTHNRVATAHKGVLRAAFHVAGRTSHATDPWRGRNAINGMAHLILDLEQYQTETLEPRRHPLLA